MTTFEKSQLKRNGDVNMVVKTPFTECEAALMEQELGQYEQMSEEELSFKHGKLSKDFEKRAGMIEKTESDLALLSYIYGKKTGEDKDESGQADLSGGRKAEIEASLLKGKIALVDSEDLDVLSGKITKLKKRLACMVDSNKKNEYERHLLQYVIDLKDTAEA
jgi:hypothetical protein